MTIHPDLDRLADEAMRLTEARIAEEAAHVVWVNDYRGYVRAHADGRLDEALLRDKRAGPKLMTICLAMLLALVVATTAWRAWGKVNADLTMFYWMRENGQ